ncbi:alpha/beta hydrolase [Aurantiacibacter zhengii]|uniref:Alpha/beta hydrolase n=1 Tax=Aurantiacibacter zhengii TaxID=2307003 RepID=A0A418NSF3_9SPHN|nr:alpha/beta hydrolase-fold protein [Aurantiacibacter zhengii]RIV85865.1 alpha/beta hydrolase [Aurantiacibacter zhengii]
MRILSFLVAAIVLSATPTYGQDVIETEPLTIGTSYLVETHEAERKVHVVTPQGYDDGEQAYPIFIMLDAGLKQDFFLALGVERWNQLWQRSAPAIFVGVETVDRQRELLPPTSTAGEQERYPTAGESDAFREWLSSEILPMIRSQYRDDGRAFLMGESAAGHFVIETWVNTPELFNGYAALSPSLQWNGQQLSRHFVDMGETERPPLFISFANEGGETEEGITRLVAEVRSDMCYSDRRNDLVHANTLHGLLPEALQYLLPTEADWLDEYGLTLRCETGRDASVAD